MRLAIACILYTSLIQLRSLVYILIKTTTKYYSNEYGKGNYKPITIIAGADKLKEETTAFEF